LFICDVVRSFVRLFVRSFIHSFIHYFINYFIHYFVRSFLSSSVHLLYRHFSLFMHCLNALCHDCYVIGNSTTNSLMTNLRIADCTSAGRFWEDTNGPIRQQ